MHWSSTADERQKEAGAVGDDDELQGQASWREEKEVEKRFKRGRRPVGGLGAEKRIQKQACEVTKM